MDNADRREPEEARSLRDARFVRALEHAPDAHLRPGASTRAAILKAGRESVDPSKYAGAGRSRWRTWLGKGRDLRMPWNAALATVVVAGFVTLLWRGEPLPDANMDSQPTSRHEAPKPQPSEQVATAQDEHAVAEARVLKTVPPRETSAPENIEQAPEVVSEAAGAAASISRAPAPATLQKTRPPAQALPAPPGRMAGAGAQLSSALPENWTHLRRWPDGVPVARTQVDGVAGQLAALAAGEHSAATTEPALADGSEPLMRVEMLRDGEALGVLDLYELAWRYQSANDGRALAGVIDAASSMRLQAELKRQLDVR